MKRTSRSRVVAMIGLAVWMVGCAGCQTFSLTEEDFAKQQRGEMVDPTVGTAVGAAGTAGSWAAMLGLAVSTLLDK